MRFLFATRGAYPPDTYGGAELSMHQLARELGRRGHACEAAARAAGWPRRRRAAGYPIFRRRDVKALVEERLAAARPDVVVTWNGGCVDIARAAERHGARVVVWIPDVQFQRYVDRLPASATLACSSRFVAAELLARAGRESPVLYPFVEAEPPAPRAPEHLLFLNPQRHKGTAIVLEVAARLPRRRVVIVDSPLVGWRERRQLRARAAKLPNVTILAPCPSLREVWAATALLLVPSQVADASPRVILEAHAAGVPVVASRVGGIPEILGVGGTLVDAAAPPATWARAVEDVLDRPPRVEPPRPELGSDAVAAAFLELAARMA